MEWFYVILAGIFEMLGVTMMNQLQQKSKENESQTLSSDSSQSLKKIIKKQSSTFICLLFGFGLSFYFLNLAMADTADEYRLSHMDWNRRDRQCCHRHDMVSRIERLAANTFYSTYFRSNYWLKTNYLNSFSFTVHWLLFNRMRKDTLRKIDS